MARVLIKDVSKKYGEVLAVKDMDLDIKDKEFIVMVGPSGCGKSTTLRMIAGLEVITSGDIYIGERLINDVPPKERKVAMVFQEYALYPHMTAYDNISFGLRVRHESREEIDTDSHSQQIEIKKRKFSIGGCILAILSISLMLGSNIISDVLGDILDPIAFVIVGLVLFIIGVAGIIYEFQQRSH